MAGGGATFVTGGRGFAGSHLVRLLRAERQEPASPGAGELDLLDRTALRSAVRELRPARVFHLAALASVARSWEEPEEVVVRNVEMTVNLLEAVRAHAPEAAVLIASSSQIYGAPERLPIDEDAPVRPMSPYATSKAACELVGRQYADARGMRVVSTRAFNHAGPGQSDEYALGSFARQVAEAERDGRAEVVLQTGDLDAARDFTDVRDVVRAYKAAIELEPGAFNVCSGRSASARRLIELLGRQIDLEIRTELDPDRLRPSEIREVRGSAARLEAATGWRPEIPLERTVADALANWREQLIPTGRAREPLG
jgi:GDP-4-dehydro-6-deoxy-D-mannose reductase